MPTFFMNIRSGDELVMDPDGSVLADTAAAQEEALLSAREMVAAMVLAGQAIDGHGIEVSDEEGVVRSILWLRDAINFA